MKERDDKVKEKSEKEREFTINRIIYWLNEIDGIKEVRDWIMESECGKDTPILRKETSFSLLWGPKKTREFRLNDSQTILVMDAFKKSIEHLEKLIEESDQELVAIAKAVYSGKIDKKGR